MLLQHISLSLIYLFCAFSPMDKTDQTLIQESLVVKKCKDFTLNGKGDHPAWENTSWTQLNPLPKAEKRNQTKVKILYSVTGIYVLAYCEDNIVSTEYDQDQGDLWKGDVFEVFLQTDPANPLYFEYEINPLNAELVILVPNNNGDFFGWAPWHYEGERKVQKAVRVHGGEAKSGEKISGWTAEMFFPYVLFKGIKNVPPTSGMKWKGNFYRIDYDLGQRISWAWQPVESTFHDYKNFGEIIFE